MTNIMKSIRIPFKLFQNIKFFISGRDTETNGQINLISGYEELQFQPFFAQNS